MTRNAISWQAQRITGLLLLPLLIAHFWVEHFMTAALRHGHLTYQAILMRIANPWWQGIDIAFLLLALYHGLNGVMGIVLDSGLVERRGARIAAAALTVLGITWAIWGIAAFRNL